MVDAAPLSPEWWVARLYARLASRREGIEFFDAYYRGAHPLPWLAPQARDEFRRILRMTRSNYMGLVVDATAERLQIDGFRLGPDEADADAETWRIWQANNLDAGSDQALLEALITGHSYLLVAPNPADPATPFIFTEHPSQAVVEFEPGSNRRVRAAGLKVWDDDWTGKLHATLYLPGGLFKYQAEKPKNGYGAAGPAWTRRAVPGEDWPAPNPLGVVPLIELANNPRMLTGGVSELSDVTDIQDRVNKTLADRLITQDYGAFPQKWATAWPEEDAQGNPTPPIDVGRNRMVTTEVAETRFGQWDAAPLDPYSAAKREDVKDIASRTRTPAQYLLGEMSNVNGETLKASESGLISKVRQRMRTFGEDIEEAARLARRAAGLADAGDSGLETIWRNPEFRTEGELVDALVKMATLNVPYEALWERWGASPTERARWVEMQAAADSTDPILVAARQLTTPPVPGATPSGS
jgi:hypothetical protein